MACCPAVSLGCPASRGCSKQSLDKKRSTYRGCCFRSSVRVCCGRQVCWKQPGCHQRTTPVTANSPRLMLGSKPLPLLLNTSSARIQYGWLGNTTKIACLQPHDRNSWFPPVLFQLAHPTLWHGSVEQLTAHELGTTLLAAVHKHLLHTVKALSRQAAFQDLKQAVHAQQHLSSSTSLDEAAQAQWSQLTCKQQGVLAAVAIFQNPPVRKLPGGRVVYDACMRMQIPKAG